MTTHTISAVPATEEVAFEGTRPAPGQPRPAGFRAWLAARLDPSGGQLVGRQAVKRAHGRRVRPILAAVPVIGVNSVSFAAQLAFLRSHLPWPLPGQGLVAVTLESVAVYLAFHAHVAQLANDAALRLRLAAYSFAAVIGAMNYSHYAGPSWRPTFAALAFGLCSMSSPWLWSVHSRRESRDALMTRGLIEAHAVRLGATRWLWHPKRSAQVMWHATWDGVNDVRQALALTEAAELPPLELAAAVLAGLTTRERLIAAWGSLGELSVPKAVALLKQQGVPVDGSTAYQVRKALTGAPAALEDGEVAS